jgi:SAM-dependent methyltransferase
MKSADAPTCLQQTVSRMPEPTDLPSRICPQCGAAEVIDDDQPVWPAGRPCPACAHAAQLHDGFPCFAPALAGTIAGMNPAAFEQLARWESGNYWFVPRNRLITKLLARYFPAARSFMEIGCGTGFVLAAIAEMKAWQRLAGSDLHPAGLSIAKTRLGTRAELVQMDARRVPARGVFDVIGAFDVLEHIEDDTAVLVEMHRALRPGGGILLAVPQHPSLWSAIDESTLHVRRYRRGELEQKVRGAGFRLLFSGSYTALLLPLMAASRWAGSAGKSDSLGREFAVPAIANTVLKAALQVEVSLTLAGVHFPAGGSRFVVATKAETQTAGTNR